MLPGKVACSVSLSEEERASLAEPIAKFLSSLHSTPITAFKGFHSSIDNLSRINASSVILKIREKLEELAPLGLIENIQELAQFINSSHS